jgi:hypothetical protein
MLNRGSVNRGPLKIYILIAAAIDCMTHLISSWSKNSRDFYLKTRGVFLFQACHAGPCAGKRGTTEKTY